MIHTTRVVFSKVMKKTKLFDKIKLQKLDLRLSLIYPPTYIWSYPKFATSPTYPIEALMTNAHIPEQNNISLKSLLQLRRFHKVSSILRSLHKMGLKANWKWVHGQKELDYFPYWRRLVPSCITIRTFEQFHLQCWLFELLWHYWSTMKECGLERMYTSK